MKEEMKLVSVIVPIYKVERFISKCVKSIMQQRYKNLEIVLVDDGSPDSSGKIIDKFAQEDPRIIVIHKKNQGVSAARNTGLSNAHGEYIIFVDGDDYIDVDCVDRFVNLIEQTNTSVALSYAVLHDDEKSLNNNINISVISGDEATEQLYLNKTGVAVWNKIYKKSFLLNNKIKFNTQLWFAEGMTFNVICFQKCDRVGTANFAVYHQVTNVNSAVRKFNLDSWHCGQKAMLYQKKLWNNSNSKIENAWNYHYREYNYNILKGLYATGIWKDNLQERDRCIYNLRHNAFYPWKVSIGVKAKIKSIIVSMFPIIAVLGANIKGEVKNYFNNGKIRFIKFVLAVLEYCKNHFNSNILKH